MSDRPPLDSFFKGSQDFSQFPKLNPSKATSMPTSSPQVAEKSANPTIGDSLIGVGKGLASTGLDLAKLASNAPVAPLGLNLRTKSNPLVQGAFDTAEGFLQASNPTQQRAKDAEQLAELFLPFVGLGAKAVTKMPAIAKSLEETSMRLTPTMKRDLGDKVSQVSDWLVQNGITGSPEKRLDKVSEIYDATEAAVSKFLKEYNTAKGFFVSKTTLMKDIKALKGDSRFKDSRDFETIIKQIDDAVENVKSIFTRERIPLDRFNNYKRSIFANAFNKAGTKVLDDVEFALGDTAKSLLEKAMRGLKIDGRDIEDFNKEYGVIINARKILREAENKNQVGNWGKLASGLLGASIGGTIGGGTGALVGGAAGPMLAPMVAGTAVRSNIGQFANAIGKLEPVARKALGNLLLAGGAVSASRLERLFGGNPPTDEIEETPEVPVEERLPLDSFINDK